MIQIKKTILTLVALLAVTTGAWAADTYTVTFAANGNTKTVENVTLPKNFQCSYNNADGDLDLILKELYGWTGDSSETICANWSTPKSSDANKVVAGKNGNDHYITIDNVFEGTVTITGDYIVDLELTQYSLEISIAAPASSGPEVAWNKAEKTGKFTMPGGNVTLEPEYYPQAALTAAPTAINDVPATTDGAIVKAGTVANIGSTETAQGTVMYYVSQTPMTDAQLLALAADQWTADVPTAEKLTKGEAYVYYYVRGNDSDTDEENFSDGDILSANALTVTIAPEPTYAVTFAEGTDPNEWKAVPATGVTKGTEVTVTYTGAKKVIGVKAEKKAAGVKVTAITLNKTATTIKVGATETLSVTAVAPDNATDKTYTWKTSDASIATVDQDGKVTAVAAGTVTIYAEANDGSGVKGNCVVTVTPATITVTINQSDWGGWDTPITKDGVTVSASMIDPNDGNLMEGGTFSTTLGNFTKIVVTAASCHASGTGWSGSGSSQTWAGTPASSVPFSGHIMGMGMGNTKFVFTIEPTN